jgi:hypothetical protein
LLRWNKKKPRDRVLVPVPERVQKGEGAEEMLLEAVVAMVVLRNDQSLINALSTSAE